MSQIIAQLEAELSATLIAADNAHKAATDDQSVAETQYDTLAIEQSYLAEGQSIRVTEIRDAIKRFENAQWDLTTQSQKVVMGSLVQLEQAEQSLQVKQSAPNKTKAEQQSCFFIAPAAGGYRCQVSDNQSCMNVTVITPQSPMGAALLGKELDDEVIVSVGSNKICDYIIAIE